MNENHQKNMEEIILQVADKLFLEKGFALTSTTEIAKMAGCNQALVHYYYRTKDNLFNKVFKNKIKIFVAIFTQIDASNDDFSTKLRRKIEAHFDLLIANPKLPFLIVNELITNSNRLSIIRNEITESHVRDQIFDALNQDLQQEIDKGTIRPISVIDLILNIISLNVFTFVALPIFQEAFGMTETEKSDFIAQRREEIIQVIFKSLRP